MMRLITAILLAILTIWLSSCNNNSSSYKEKPKTPEELKAELKLQEQMSPLTYINDKNVKLTPQQKKIRDVGLFRDAEYVPDGAIIEGDFVNTATLAKFKDIVVSVSFYSQTETLIEEKSYVLYEYLDPNTTKHFTMKIAELPKAYKKFAFEVTGVTPGY